MATTGKIGVTTENIFPVIKKFLYSDHEIFLRELVANAVDATQKMKALAATGEFKNELGEIAVRVELDEEAKTLKVIDNGIGMTEEEAGRCRTHPWPFPVPPREAGWARCGCCCPEDPYRRGRWHRRRSW